jgi:elongation factor 1-alpha
MKWYTGPTLIEALNNLEGTPYKQEGIARFISYDLDERHGFGTFLMGKTLGSSLKVGESVMILPQGVKDEIKDIWIQDHRTQEIKAGDHGSILLKSSNKDLMEDGLVLANNLISYQAPSSVKARLLILEGTFIPGTSVVCHCGASYSTAQVSKILKILKINPKHKKLPREFEGNLTIAFPNELVELELLLDSPLVVEVFSDFPELGRLILRHSGQTIAVGIVHEVVKNR